MPPSQLAVARGLDEGGTLTAGAAALLPVSAAARLFIAGAVAQRLLALAAG